MSFWAIVPVFDNLYRLIAGENLMVHIAGIGTSLLPKKKSADQSKDKKSSNSPTGKRTSNQHGYASGPTTSEAILQTPTPVELEIFGGYNTQYPTNADNSALQESVDSTEGEGATENPFTGRLDLSDRKFYVNNPESLAQWDEAYAAQTAEFAEPPIIGPSYPGPPYDPAQFPPSPNVLGMFDPDNPFGVFPPVSGAQAEHKAGTVDVIEPVGINDTQVVSVSGDSALQTVLDEFDVFDTAKHPGSDLDGLISRDDLQAVKDSHTASEAQRSAAAILLDNNELFDELDMYEQNQYASDNKISIKDIRGVVAGRIAGNRVTGLTENTATELLHENFEAIAEAAVGGTVTRHDLARVLTDDSFSDELQNIAAYFLSNDESFTNLEGNQIDGKINRKTVTQALHQRIQDGLLPAANALDEGSAHAILFDSFGRFDTAKNPGSEGDDRIYYGDLKAVLYSVEFTDDERAAALFVLNNKNAHSFNGQYINYTTLVSELGEQRAQRIDTSLFGVNDEAANTTIAEHAELFTGRGQHISKTRLLELAASKAFSDDIRAAAAHLLVSDAYQSQLGVDTEFLTIGIAEIKERQLQYDEINRLGDDALALQEDGELMFDDPAAALSVVNGLKGLTGEEWSIFKSEFGALKGVLGLANGTVQVLAFLEAVAAGDYETASEIGVGVVAPAILRQILLRVAPGFAGPAPAVLSIFITLIPMIAGESLPALSESLGEITPSGQRVYPGGHGTRIGPGGVPVPANQN